MSLRSVVVAHRESMVAEGIAAALARYPEIVPVGFASTVDECERRAQQVDAVALDGLMPGAEELGRRLRRRGVRVVCLADEGRTGDQGVRISTHSPVADLASALVPGCRQNGPTTGLTQRERDILALVSRGLVGKQVARHLGISPKTVENHKTRIFAKLGVPNQAAAVSCVLESIIGRTA